MRTLAIFLVPLVGLLAACGQVPVEPEGKGSLTLELVPGGNSASFGQTAGSGQRSTVLDRPAILTEAEGAALSGLVSVPTCAECSDDSSVRARSVAFPPLESVEVRLNGPTTRTVGLPRVGNAFEGTIGDLAPGTYSVLVLGSGGGEITFLGTASNVRVTAGQNTTATVAFNAFQSVLNPFVTPTYAFAAPLDFSLVTGATFYQLEVSRSGNFSDAVIDTIPDNDGWAWFVGAIGRYSVRIRAGNQIINSFNAVASNVELFEVVEDLVGNTAATAANLGSGTAAAGVYTDLNITSGDRDYFRVGLQAGDNIAVAVFTTSLLPTSRLDPIVRIEDASGNVIAVNDNIDATTVEAAIPPVTIVAPGDYFVHIAGVPPAGVGHYEFDLIINGVGFASRRTVSTPD